MKDKELAALTQEQAKRLVPDYVFREIVRMDTADGTGYMLSNRAEAWLMDGDNCVILHKAGFGQKLTEPGDGA